MSGPWERYQRAGTGAGPWEKYAQPATSEPTSEPPVVTAGFSGAPGLLPGTPTRVRQITPEENRKILEGAAGAALSTVPGALPAELALGAAGGALMAHAEDQDPLTGSALDVAGQLVFRGLGKALPAAGRAVWRAFRGGGGEVVEEAAETAGESLLDAARRRLSEMDELVGTTPAQNREIQELTDFIEMETKGTLRGGEIGVTEHAAGKPATRRALVNQLVELGVSGDLSGKSATQLRAMLRERGVTPTTASGGARTNELAAQLPAEAGDIPEVDRSLTKMGDHTSDLEAIVAAEAAGATRPARVFYHGSDAAGAAAIERQGGLGRHTESIWLTPDRAQAEAFARRKGGKVFEVSAEDLPPEVLAQAEDGPVTIPTFGPLGQKVVPARAAAEVAAAGKGPAKGPGNARKRALGLLEEEPDTLFDQRFDEATRQMIDAPPLEAERVVKAEVARHMWHPEHGVVRVDARKGSDVMVSTQRGRPKLVDAGDLVPISDKTAARLGEGLKPATMDETPVTGTRPRTEAEAVADLDAEDAAAGSLAPGTGGPTAHLSWKKRTNPFAADSGGAGGSGPKTPKISAGEAGLSPELHDKLADQLHLQRQARMRSDDQLVALRSKQASVIRKWEDAARAGELPWSEARLRIARDLDGLTAKYKKLNPGAFTPDELEQLHAFAAEQPFTKDAFALKRSMDNLQTMQQGKQLAPKEIEEVRRVFFARDALPKTSKFWDVLAKILTFPSGSLKALKASFDLSGTLRQAKPLTLRYPVTAARAFWDQLQALVSEGRYQNIQAAINDNPLRYLQELSGLHMSDLSRPARSVASELRGAEEVFAGSGLIKKFIPGIKQSERAYITYLNKMRSEVFNKHAMELLKAGKTFDKNARDFTDLARAVNELSGRGELSLRLGNKRFVNLDNKYVTPILNSALFSPRFLFSRLGLLMDLPHFYSNYSPQARKLMLQSVWTTISANLSMLGLAAAAGASVEWDLRSTDFAKIRLGNTRIDPWFGLQPWVRMFAQIATGQTKSTTTGQIRDLNQPGFGKRTRLDVASSFAVGKLSPGAALTLKVLRGREAYGFEPSEFLKGEFPYLGRDVLTEITPLVIQDIQDAVEAGDAQQLALTTPLAILGEGVQTYEPGKRKRR